jgi:hypothetical protein
MRSRLALLVVALFGIVAASASASGSVGFYGCRAFTAKHPVAVVKPRSIMIACGDGNLYVTGIRWQSWGTSLAKGTATAHANDCKPACYAGHFHTYAATVTLSAPKTCRGSRVFTTLVYDVPRLAHGHGSTTFGC